jgi:fucose permease
MRRARLLVIIWVTFFAISLVSNILGPLIPDVIKSFRLSLSMAAFLPFSFFLAYGLCSIPAGLLVERRGEKAVVLAAFALVLAGSLAFALRHAYAVAIGSLFTIGIGMALLQVAINPLLRVVGGEQHFAFNSVLGQLVFGLASFLSPWLYSFLATRPGAGALAWTSLYWLFVAVALGMFVLVGATRFPSVHRTEDERAASATVYLLLARRPMVIAYFVAIFAYVGTEQGIANWISEFLRAYHGVDPQTAGAQTVAWFWGLMTAGCALGLYLLRRLDSRVVLAAFTTLAIALLSAGLFGPTTVARWALPLLGFSASVMWSVIFSLALNSVPEHHGAFSGILCTAIVGGAVVPWAIGWLGDRFGLRTGMLLLYGTLAYILSVARWARPIVINETR